MVSGFIATAYQTLFDLRIPEWRIIAVVAESEGITQLDIGTATRMDKMTVSRAAIALADRGLLERSANPADKRSHLLILSSAGRQLYKQVAPTALKLEKEIFDSFTRAELNNFETMLRRIEALLLDRSTGHGVG